MSIITEKDAKQRVRELVLRVKEDAGLEGLPYYRGVNDPIARHLEIVVKEQPVQYGDGGMYVATSPPEIGIDPAAGNQERLNFTFFHEVCHHLIREDGELYGFLHDHSPKNMSATVERYCDIGAAEFLVPMNHVREIINERGFSIELISILDEVFPASKPAIAIQLAQCALHECVIMVCEYGLIPKRNDRQSYLGNIPIFDQLQLFVRYSSGSPAYKYNTGRYIPIPNEHPIMTAYETEQLVKGRGNIPVHSGNEWPNDCEAYFYKGKVYAAFNVTAPTSPNQMAFRFS